MDNRISLFNDKLIEWWPYRYKSTLSFNNSWRFGLKIFEMDKNNFCRITVYIGHLSKKWRESSGALKHSHKSDRVSWKLWFFLWHLRGLNPTRSWKIYLRPTLSWTPNIDLPVGLIRAKMFRLKIPRDVQFRNSLPMVFHDLTTLGKKLFVYWDVRLYTS